MGRQKYWLLAGAGVPVLILLLAFTQFSKGSQPNLKPSSSPPAQASNPKAQLDSTSPSIPIPTSGVTDTPDQLCIVDSLPRGVEVRTLVKSSNTAGAVIGNVKPGAQIALAGEIQAKRGQENTLEIVPISFKRKDLLANPSSVEGNPEELISAAMWKVVFDQTTHPCQ
ncbi:MAG: hypothetical protein QNJ46_26435 [Leptolyngbyaceae cyanobacterium MO_188.B28]|nr:hypothetical protein [Leptolyngbyaceae cyanobacterium MO_188.B28]